MRNSLVTTALILALPLMLGAKGKCRKDRSEPTDVPEVVDPEPVPDPDVEIQVVSVSPTRLKPATPTPMKAYGAGFASGAQVAFGGFRVTQVTFEDANTLSFTSPGLPVGTHDFAVTNPSGEVATLRQAVTVQDEVDDTCRRMAMYFELDSASLSATARSALDAAMPCLRKQASIRLEGHADERGTTDYNVALGQRRAETVQRYLATQGIPESKLPVLSYGEERPMDPASNERAWAQNRRVDMVGL